MVDESSASWRTATLPGGGTAGTRDRTSSRSTRPTGADLIALPAVDSGAPSCGDDRVTTFPRGGNVASSGL